MKYDQSKYKIWNWKNPFNLHWILNPGLAFNELVLGQRIPKISLIEINNSKSLQEKTKVPCPHCGTIHSGLKWSNQNNSFKNWFGLYCDNCGKIIPCLTNLTSMFLLCLTFPIWIWFKANLKNKWMKNQPERYKNLDLENSLNPYANYGWIKIGFSWGFFMFVFMTIILFLIGGNPFSMKKILLNFVWWMSIGGLGYGYLMKMVAGKSKLKK